MIAWGVSLPANGKELGRGNVWLPLKALRCGSSEVKALAAAESAGLIAAGDESGLVVLWEAYEVRSGRGAGDILLQIYEETDNDGEEFSGEALYADFRPDDFREVLRVQTGSSGVSALLLLPDTLAFYAGTEDGSVHAISNFHESRGKVLKPLDKPDKSSAAAVRGFHFAQYRVYETTVPAVFVYFAAGQLSVIEHNTLSCLAYCAVAPAISGSGKSEPPAEASDFVSEMLVLNSQFDALPQPTLLETTQSVSAAAAAATRAFRSKTVVSESSAASTDSSPLNAKPARMSLFASRPKSSASSTSPMAPAAAEEAPPEDPVDEKLLPRFLMLVRGKALLTFDLQRLAAASSKQQTTTSAGGSMWKSSTSSVPQSPSASITSSRNISQHPVVAAALLRFAPEDEGADRLCFACVNRDGLFVLVSTKQRAPVSHSNLLEGVLDVEADRCLVRLGVVLRNCDVYFLSDARSMIYSATARSEAYAVSEPLPQRASPQSTAPTRDCWLLHGREDQMAQMKATLKKRRSSVINISAAPTDLYKIFSKTRHQRGREELLEDSSRDYGDDHGSSAKAAGRGANKAMSELNQVKANFEERGQRINQIALKMDDFKQSAQQYRQQVAVQKEELKKKNSRWGLF